MKKILCFIICIAMLVPMLAGCGSFFSEPELQIAAISSELLEDGQTKITIKYTDTTKAPLEFFIPAGKTGDEGKEGAGIQSIEYERDTSGKATKVIINYTDGRVPSSFTVPDGLYSIAADIEYDDITNSYYVIFTYSDNTKSEPYYIGAPEKGDKGDRGNGIKAYDVSTDDDGNIVVTLEFDEGDPCIVTIPKNVGIDYMDATYDDENYYINIVYNNGTGDSFTLPLPTKWYYGNSTPGSNIGRDGDYYFNEKANIIYRMIDGSWEPVVYLGNSVIEYKVTFDLNDSVEEPASMGNYEYVYKFKNGECFASNNYRNGNVPVPTRDGYVFDGWYAKAVINEPMTTSRFTDLTPISSDITLYAKWVPEP